MSRATTSLGPPRTTHPHPPAPSRLVLQPSGAAPAGGGLRLLAARLLADQVERMGRADGRLERLLAAGLRAAAVRGVTRAGGARGGAEVGREGSWPRAEDFARMLGLESVEVRELIRFDRTLSALPRIASAYDAGDLPRAKLLAVLPSATPDTQDLWLARAARYEAAVLGAEGAGEGTGQENAPRPAPPGGDEFPVWMSATGAVREALRPLGPGTDPSSLIEGRVADPPRVPGPDATLFDPCGAPDAARREARLRHLVALRQSVEWRLGRLLAAVRRHALHLDPGFASLEAWAFAVAGLTPRRVGRLLALDDALEKLPATADAWRRGRITRGQAGIIARAAAPRTERDWLRLARQVAPDRLEALARAATSAGTGAPRAAGLGSMTSADGARRAAGPGAHPGGRGVRGMTMGAPLSGSRRTSTSVS